MNTVEAHLPVVEQDLFVYVDGFLVVSLEVVDRSQAQLILDRVRKFFLVISQLCLKIVIKIEVNRFTDIYIDHLAERKITQDHYRFTVDS